MAKRQNTRKIPSVEVQGEDSFVTVRKVTWAQVIESQKKVLAAGTADDAPPTLDAVLANDTAIREMLRTNVIGWNWVDDDGRPLPLPHDEGSFNLLSLDEVTFLVQALYQKADDLKN